MEAEVYEKMRALEEQHWWFVARRRYIDQLIRRCVRPNPGARFCEVGAGTGGNLALLGSHATTDAVEYDADAVEIIRARSLPNLGQVEQGGLPDNLPFDARFDAVFALDVVEHVEDDLAAVQALAGLLSPGGVLILTVPAYQWLWSGHDVVNQHYRRYSGKQFCNLVERAGLRVEFSSFFNTLLFPLKLLQHLKDKLLPPAENQWQVNMPSPWLNTLLTGIFGIERYLAGRVPMPFGLSVAVVARKA